jgi:hypothetical protein
VRRIALVLLVTGCSVADEPYPLTWDPLPPAASADCAHFRGVYSDRGESPSSPNKPSLTRELFGQESPWEKAVSIELEPGDGTLDIRVATPAGDAYSRQLTEKAGDFVCNRGTLVVRNRRWVYSDLMSGRESVKIEMHRADRHLVTRVDETTTGVMFMVVPLSGESARWYRFSRLKP